MAKKKSNATYSMSITLNVLNHLGINLYSNVPAVLSEVVANAWDADAEYVDIKLHDDGKISITDNGHGMTVKDANEKFLKVGYQRRVEGEAITKTLNRPVMGRKGIGKLSLFSIAKKIEVYSKKGRERHGFRMTLDEIVQHIENKDTEYHPEEINPNDFPADLSKGTRVVISDFKRSLRQTEINLRRRLARRFSVIEDGQNFSIKINGKPISVEDRDYFEKIQFLWHYGGATAEYKKKCTQSAKITRRPNKLRNNNNKITGWIGTVRESGLLIDQDTRDNLNKIIIMVRGKVAQEDILSEFNEGGMYTKYIFGEITADFLDSDDKEDIATSSRQKLLEDDERYIELKDFIGQELKHIQSSWTELRNEQGTTKAIEIPAIKDWYQSLGKDIKKRAESLFGKINQLTLASEQDRKSLLKHGILAFESMRVKENLDALDKLEGNELNEFIKIFDDIDDIESTFYRQIVQSRVEVIHSLQKKIDANSREQILQEHIYDHLWLLDTGWERADSTQYMEQQVQTEFDKIDAKLTEKEKKGRVDIKYRTTSGKHLIIELKKADRVVSTSELMRQCDKYRKALRKLLDVSGKTNEPIEVICIVGKPLSDWGNGNPTDREESRLSLQPKNIRVVMYNELIETAEKSYQAYLNKKIEAGKIYDLIQKIDDTV